MFERRLKILLLVLVLITAALVVRAFQIQVIDHEDWRKKASDQMTTVQYTETTRGMLRDRLNRVLAQDVPSIDACVDYRAIPPEPDAAWLKQYAEKNLRARLGTSFSSASQEGKKKLIDDEIASVRGGVIDMWATLAQVAGKSPDEIDEARREIEQKIQMRQTDANWRAGHIARRDDEALPWYDELLDEEVEQGGNPDKSAIVIPEQSQPQVILTGLTPDQQVELSHDMDKFPALSLLPGKHRNYPFGDAACHILGQLGLVGPQDLASNKNVYGPRDLIGRAGIEALCEKTLRGSRGKIEKVAGSDEVLSTVDAIPGKDVKLSIDIELQSDIENAFLMDRIYKNLGERSNQHGSCVIFKVDTGEVLAMVSNPGFDPNTLADKLHDLAMDDLNLPLLNRATEMAVEPGSTVKVIVGSGAITDGVMTEESKIECKGILVINGREQPTGHCWTYPHYKAGEIPEPTHNAISLVNSRGEDLPDNMLTISDGLERSCNVVFGTVAFKMGIHSLSDWLFRFGIGRPTGVGLPESVGRLYRPTVDNDRSGLLVCAAGIGEQVVQATPIQMANVAATIARDGIWLRPRLVSPTDVGRATTRPAPDLGPDLVDLHLSPQALHAVQTGMIGVVNGRHGTGWGIRPEDQQPKMPDDPLEGMEIAGKTGTAQTAPLSKPKRDADGHILLGPDKKIIYDKVDIGTPGTKEWYGSVDGHYQHAWFIGYAPADHPQVAFCVMVEYGEAGGTVAGSIAHDALVACVRHGYLTGARSDSAPDPVDIH